MSKWEEDMIEQIRKESEDIKIPDSLRPDQIEKRLSERPKKYHWKKGYTAGLAAACCLLVCGAVWGIQKSPQRVSPVEKTRYSNQTMLKSSDLQTAKSYDQIYEYLRQNQDNQYGTDTGMLERGVVTESAEDHRARIQRRPRIQEWRRTANPQKMQCIQKPMYVRKV